VSIVRYVVALNLSLAGYCVGDELLLIVGMMDDGPGRVVLVMSLCPLDSLCTERLATQ
jgi:hypothetical protein